MYPFPETVLVKTPRGCTEISARAHGLTALERRLLILSNAKRTVAEIAAELGRPATDSGFRRALAALERGRYVDRLEELEFVA